MGKTSVAAATGIKSAEMGHRTVVMSLDVAHSLSEDSSSKYTLARS